MMILESRLEVWHVEVTSIGSHACSPELIPFGVVFGLVDEESYAFFCVGSVVEEVRRSIGNVIACLVSIETRTDHDRASRGYKPFTFYRVTHVLDSKVA